MIKEMGRSIKSVKPSPFFGPFKVHKYGKAYLVRSLDLVVSTYLTKKQADWVCAALTQEYNLDKLIGRR